MGMGIRSALLAGHKIGAMHNEENPIVVNILSGDMFLIDPLWPIAEQLSILLALGCIVVRNLLE